VAQEVEVDRVERPHRMTEVAREVERLHEHLGKNHRGPQVDVDATRESRDALAVHVVRPSTL